MSHTAPQSTLPQLCIVVPTYNERDNVRPLVALLDAALDGIRWEAVFVDDDSPDGTAEEVAAVGRADTRIRVLHRVGRRGLAGACIEGILSSIAPVAAVIDADLQHDETILPRMLAHFDSDATDLVIGTRNADGGTAGDGLSPIRKWGSDAATALARRFLKISATDPMSGFFMVRRASFNRVVTELQTDGFKILADMLSASRGKWTVQEVGYTFRERQHGESKMDAAVTLEFLGLVVARMTGGLLPIRFVLFGMVGVSGIFVQLLFVRLGLWADMSFGWAQTLGVWAAMTSNFFLNNALTYRDRALRGFSMLRGLISFYAVCAVGAVMNVGVADAIYGVLPQWALASIAGAVVGAVWNFVASAFVTWRAR